MENLDSQGKGPVTTGDELVKVFDALSHPARVQIMGILSAERRYISELARLMNISRPLLYMHLQKLEAAGLVHGNHEISEDGRAMKYYEIRDFELHLTPRALSEYSKTVTVKKET